MIPIGIITARDEFLSSNNDPFDGNFLKKYSIDINGINLIICNIKIIDGKLNIIFVKTVKIEKWIKYLETPFEDFI